MRALFFAISVVTVSFALLSLADSSPHPHTPPYPLQVRQQLTVVCMRYTPGDAPLRIQDRFSALSAEDMALLRKCVPSGAADVTERGIYEDGPKAKAILLLTGPFQCQAAVKQPWRSTVIYLQDRQTFTVLPKDAALSDRCIYLEQQADVPRYTTYAIDLAEGGRMGGSAGSW